MCRLNYIPIDFIKAEVIGLSKTVFETNSLLDFICKVSTSTGEIFEYKEARFKNFKIQIFNSGRVWISGSIHIYSNDGKHNYNDMNQSCFLNTLKLLKKELLIEPFNLKILNLEWGYNIIPLLLMSNYVIDRCVQHLSVDKTVGIDCKIEGKYIQFKHSNYILKIYNKGLQYKLNKEVLRIEVKQMNWSKYRAKGIYTLEDFINCDKKVFFDELITQWNNIIFYDIDNTITKKYIEYQTNTFWNERNNLYSRKNKKYHLDKLKKLNKTIGYNTQNKIVELLIKKGNELQV
ncbi:hypothetical protein [Wenyingzhuangia sp. 2_MG-2023]|uniref:hypothetical protein n=1 Tax=Wenyingzhuangia sp. 2_MG-2023 TaxID=3062639 RepID=UPI0026E3814F|nr:hypothetical protein [Wenyingzhuangia sp. 2_MG-2023]MDO6736516.1 hypothetical protein [Wenyingzhuangia sp. 2_MG-2023]